MPSKPPAIATKTADQLIALGQKIAAHRKALGISATAAAEAASMSRVTLHRIEKGEPAVTMGAYVNAMTALGLNFGLIMPAELIESHQSALTASERQLINELRLAFGGSDSHV